VAKLSRGMGLSLVKGWLSEGWVAKVEGWVAQFVAQLNGFESRLKNHQWVGPHKQRNSQHTKNLKFLSI
jgi:hypothetical protein